MRITSYTQFKSLVGGFPRNGNFLYRGIGAQYQLLPSISYSDETNTTILLQQAAEAQRIFNKNYYQNNPDRILSDYQLVFLARHCGLRSPFMDFTFDDTVAIQFGINMAKDNSVNLFVLDINGEVIFNSENGILESGEFRIYRPDIIWNKNGLLTRERTQFIQYARLISQSNETITMPFDKTFSNKLTCYKIFPEDFEKIKREIEKEGIATNRNLLIDENDFLSQIAKEVNVQVQG